MRAEIGLADWGESKSGQILAPETSRSGAPFARENRQCAPRRSWPRRQRLVPTGPECEPGENRNPAPPFGGAAANRGPAAQATYRAEVSQAASDGFKSGVTGFPCRSFSLVAPNIAMLRRFYLSPELRCLWVVSDDRPFIVGSTRRAFPSIDGHP